MADPQIPPGAVSTGGSAVERTTEAVPDTTKIGSTGDPDVSVLEHVKNLAKESPVVDDADRMTVLGTSEKGASLYLTRSDSDMAQDKLNRCCGVCLEG